jgi:hypothetical protein
MTKAELLVALASKSGGTILSTELVSTSGNVKRYKSIVFTIGAEYDGVPIAQSYDVYFYVQDEDDSGEQAYYVASGFQNLVERNPTGSTLTAIHGIFYNDRLRERTLGEVAKAIRIKMAGTPSDESKRIAKHFITNTNGVLDLFMAWVASNSTIQANGGAAADSDLDYVIQTEAWDKVGAALGI